MPQHEPVTIRLAEDAFRPSPGKALVRQAERVSHSRSEDGTRDGPLANRHVASAQEVEPQRSDRPLLALRRQRPEKAQESEQQAVAQLSFHCRPKWMFLCSAGHESRETVETTAHER